MEKVKAGTGRCMCVLHRDNYWFKGECVREKREEKCDNQTESHGR